MRFPIRIIQHLGWVPARLRGRHRSEKKGCLPANPPAAVIKTRQMRDRLQLIVAKSHENAARGIFVHHPFYSLLEVTPRAFLAVLRHAWPEPRAPRRNRWPRYRSAAMPRRAGASAQL